MREDKEEKSADFEFLLNKIEDLHLRVAVLEKELRILKGLDSSKPDSSGLDGGVVAEGIPRLTKRGEGSVEQISSDASSVKAALDRQDPFVFIAKSVPHNADSSQETHNDKKTDELKASSLENKGEFFVGKYIIGSLAALLFFLSAAFFLSDIWASMSNSFKAALIFFMGILLYIVGYRRLTQGEQSVIFSALTGIGSGLTLISILASYSVFNLISIYATLPLIMILSLSFMCSYKAIRKFFPVVIAYNGAYFAMCLGFRGSDSSADTLVLSLFITAFGFAAERMGSVWMTPGEKRGIAYMNLVSFLTLTYMVILRGPSEIIYTQIFLFLPMYAVFLNIAKLESQKSLIFISLFLILTFEFTVLVEIFEKAGIEFSVFPWIFILSNLAFLYIGLRFSSCPDLIFYLLSIYTGCVSFFYFYQYYIPVFGFFFFAILAYILMKRLKYGINVRYVRVLLWIDCVCFFISVLTGKAPGVWTLILFFIPFLALTYLIFDWSADAKCLAVFAAFFLIPSEFWLVVFHGSVLTYFFSFMTSFLCLLGLYFFNWFKDCSSLSYLCSDLTFSRFRKDKGENVSVVSKNNFAFFCVSVIFLILAGVVLSYFVDYNAVLFSFVIFAIAALFLLLSYESIAHDKDSRSLPLGFGGFFILVNLFLAAGCGINAVSLSLAGIVLGFLYVLIGFSADLRKLRKFGLIATIVMILKIFLVDINYLFLKDEVSVLPRVFIFAAGGVFCLAITALYGKFEKIFLSKQDSDKHLE